MVVMLVDGCEEKVMVVMLHSISMKERSKDMFYSTMHLTHFIYGYMALDMVKDQLGFTIYKSS